MVILFRTFCLQSSPSQHSLYLLFGTMRRLKVSRVHRQEGLCLRELLLRFYFGRGGDFSDTYSGSDEFLSKLHFPTGIPKKGLLSLKEEEAEDKEEEEEVEEEVIAVATSQVSCFELPPPC